MTAQVFQYAVVTRAARVVRNFGPNAAEAAAWVLTDPPELHEHNLCRLVVLGDTGSIDPFAKLQWFSRKRKTRAWKQGLDNYVVVNTARQIVAAFDQAPDAIAFARKHESDRFGWHVTTAGDAALAGFPWYDEDVTRATDRLPILDGQVQVTYHPDADEVTVRILPADERMAPLEVGRMNADMWRTVASVVPADPRVWDASILEGLE